MSSYIESTSVRKMAAFDHFKNCFNLTDEQTEVIVLVRGASAAACCAILSTVLVVFMILAILQKTRNRVCGTVVKWFSFELIAVSVEDCLEPLLNISLLYSYAVMALYQLNFAMQLVYFYHHDEEYCKANRFFSQYFGIVELIFLLGISLALFFKMSPEV